MGKFDGILLCSDFDSTLAISSKVSQENVAAVKYFEENGGKFSIVTGRSPHYVEEHLVGFPVNAPVSGYNGAIIYDATEKEMLYTGGRYDYRYLDLMQQIWEKDPAVTQVIFHSDHRHAPHVTRDGEVACPIHFVPHVIHPIYNAICCTAPGDSMRVRDELIRLVRGEFIVERSWPGGIEVISPGEQKGDAVRRIQEVVGARTVVAVGDFENDISMLEAADIGYAVENATPDVKAIADRITVNCRDHALAAIVKELEIFCKEGSLPQRTR